jgi:hypothetical protein
MAPSMAILAGVDMPTTHELRWQRWITRVVKVGSRSRCGREWSVVYIAIGGWHPIIAKRVVGEPRNR